MKLYAFRDEIPSNKKVALGPLVFTMDDNKILSPQPTDDQVVQLGLSAFLTLVEVDATEVAQPEPAPEPPPFTGRVEVAQTAPNVIMSLIDESDFDEDEPVTPPTVDKPVEVDVKSMSLAQLRNLCEERGVPYETSATKAKLITLLTKA